MQTPSEVRCRRLGRRLGQRTAPWSAVLATVLVGCYLLSAPQATADDQALAKERLRPSGIEGALVICGGGKLPEAIQQRFLELAGGEKAHLVFIPTASETADREPADKLLAPWKATKAASVALLHTRSRQTANEPQFVEPLRKATGVWFGGGVQSRIADAYLGTAVEKELYAVLTRGGVIGGTSAGAAILSRVMIASGNPEAKIGQGFDLLPGTVIDQHFLKRQRQPRLSGVLDKHPSLLGIGIDEGTALVVGGRQMKVLGESSVSLCLAGSPTRLPRTVMLKAEAVADLTAWHRAALARSEPPFPQREAPVPEVAKGSLVIVGGGGMPAEVTQRFLELAGGPDALIVILPTAGPDPIPANSGAGFLQRAGARNVHVLPAREKTDVEAPRSLELLRQAKAIWFGGGRQWRFIDAYEGTKAHELFRDVLRRGGVIGGSSAGATIQGDYLCRGSPLGNFEMMCEGYEHGLGFLPGVAIDQHFTQRKRFGDMTALMKAYPQLLGIGIDEGTALIVQGHVAQIVGRNQAHFYDRRKPVEDSKPDYEAVKSGGRYDLKARKVLIPAGQEAAPADKPRAQQTDPDRDGGRGRLRGERSPLLLRGCQGMAIPDTVSWHNDLLTLSCLQR